MTQDGMGRPEAPLEDVHGTGRARDTLRVTVRYAAALKPFSDEDASRGETLAALKVRVLDKFGLVEGASTPDGSTFVYKLYHGKDELTDLSRPLGDVAGNAGALQLKLSQFIQQGALGRSESAW